MQIANKNTNEQVAASEMTSGESGFSIIEAVIAIIILTIALLGIAAVFAYATTRNTGNNTRSQALAVLQQEVENIRALKFTPKYVDNDLKGGTKPVKTVTVPNNGTYSVAIKVDDDPSTPNSVQVDSASDLKEVTIEVTQPNQSEKWVSASPAVAVFRRVRAN
jgi:Tfp pilus assembly protein PilV